MIKGNEIDELCRLDSKSTLHDDEDFPRHLEMATTIQILSLSIVTVNVSKKTGLRPDEQHIEKF